MMKLSRSASDKSKASSPAKIELTPTFDVLGEKGPAPAMPESWAELARQISHARTGDPFAGGHLRMAVRRVVRDIRATGGSWELVYFALAAAVGELPKRDTLPVREHERHDSRAAALVAHMQCWADVERLEELEATG